MADPNADDLLLTAFIDGELPPHEHEALTARLASEPRLSARLKELRQGGIALQSAFSAALGEAPRRDMAARLPRARSSLLSRNWARAAAIAAIAFLAEVAVSRMTGAGHAPEPESWRQSVAEYMSLYTTATFAPREEAQLRGELKALSESVGVDLSDSALRYGALAPRSGVLLQFNGAPLAQVGYVADGEPAAFCIIRDGEPDAAPTRERIGAFNVISWAKSGRGFMVLSAASADRLDDLARSLRNNVAVN